MLGALNYQVQSSVQKNHHPPPPPNDLSDISQDGNAVSSMYIWHLFSRSTLMEVLSRIHVFHLYHLRAFLHCRATWNNQGPEDATRDVDRAARFNGT